ncbi:MAG: hypothetical protein OXH54_04235 [Acidimicrobiaceae bacterium]|nr:hypothetical protein [Acidimicrobiaceae bacterium]
MKVVSLKIASLIAVVVAMLVGALFATQASAKPSGESESAPLEAEESAPAGAPLLWEEDGSVAYDHATPPCSGNLGRIHASTHRPGRMNVTFTVRCDQEMSTLHVWAQLWEDRWWGWDRIGVKGKSTSYNVTGSTVHANDRCRNNYIRATSGGWGILNGTYHQGPAYTEYATNPCNL